MTTTGDVDFLQELRFEINEHNLPIRSDQIRTRIAAYPMMIGSQALLAIFLVWLMWEQLAPSVLMGWLAALLSVLALDALFLARNRQKTRSIAECRIWHHHFLFFVTVIGLLWGSTGVLMFVPGDLGYQALLICVILGLAAGAVTINPVHPPSLYIWLFVLILPITINELVGGGVHLVLGVMLLLFLGMVLNAGQSLSLMFLQSVRRSYENTSLVEQLTAQKRLAEQARELAETANTEKSRFLAAASHDLRQPLQALVLFSDALKGSVGEKDKGIKKLAGQIESSVNALLSMFNELLNVSRLEAGVVQPQWLDFDVQPLFDRLYVDFAQMAQAKGLVFEIPSGAAWPEGLVVHSDPWLLEQIVRNFLSNAIRYTETGKVELRCQFDGDRLKIVVVDTGVGISADDLPHIFEEYFQAKNSHRDRRLGLGLGLAIVGRVGKLLGYPITVDSTPGIGSTFCLAIALGDSSCRSWPYSLTESDHDVAGVRVALLEDDPDIRQTEASLLESWGCQVFAGVVPDEVIAQFQAAGTRPDILVSDYRLPEGMTAIHASRQMRAIWGEALPVLVLTGDTASKTLHEIYSSNAVLLHKPIAPARLRSLIHLVLHGK
ncbi:MAG: response regulator [Nitrosomonadales bacterium]|nr:response regulator [Nitrosomonadales bacterium]